MSRNDEEVRKFLQRQHDAEAQKEKLKTYKNAAGTPLFEDYNETHEVQIIPDKSVRAAMFVPDPINPKKFRAHPETIAAMRKELFMGGEDFVDLEHFVKCKSCRSELDLQFWKHCPYCGGSFE